MADKTQSIQETLFDYFDQFAQYAAKNPKDFLVSCKWFIYHIFLSVKTSTLLGKEMSGKSNKNFSSTFYHPRPKLLPYFLFLTET